MDITDFYSYQNKLYCKNRKLFFVLFTFKDLPSNELFKKEIDKVKTCLPQHVQLFYTVPIPDDFLSELKKCKESLSTLPAFACFKNGVCFHCPPELSLITFVTNILKDKTKF
jgi:hypothetical protein